MVWCGTCSGVVVTFHKVSLCYLFFLKVLSTPALNCDHTFYAGFSTPMRKLIIESSKVSFVLVKKRKECIFLE